jgi:superfamily II DNA or RNA helicase
VVHFSTTRLVYDFQMDSEVYSSCNQVAKNLVNRIIVREACINGIDDEKDCMLTLDAEYNGTSIECRKKFRGLISVPQFDPDVANTQKEHWKAMYPDDNMHVVHAKHDICKDLPKLVVNFWTNGKNPILWNFDLFSTFYTYPVELAGIIAQIPQQILSSTSGSLLAFTFQAIPHRGFLSRIRNTLEWKNRVEEFLQMKSWKKSEVMHFYQMKMDMLWREQLPPCVTMEKVDFYLEDSYINGVDDVYLRENAFLYKGKTDNESTMCVLMYRARHEKSCQCEHTVKPKKRKRELQVMERSEMENLEYEITKRRKLNKNPETESRIMEVETNSLYVEEAENYSDDNCSDMASMVSLSCTEDGSENDDVSSDDEGSITSTLSISSMVSLSCTEDGSENDDVSSDDEGSITSTLSISSMVSLSCTEDGSEEPGDTHDSGYHSATDPQFQYKLYDHQIEILQAIQEHQRGIVNAICGSGKSLPMVKSCLCHRTSIIFVPFKVLVDQFALYFNDDLSEATVHKVNSDHLGDIPLPNQDETTVYLANFDSLHRMRDLGIIFDVIHWDEAHLATSSKRRGKISGETNEALDMEDLNTIQSRRHFFWTATPNQIMKCHPEIYGEEIYTYSFRAAVKDRIIKSFGIYISCNKGDDGEDNEKTRYDKILETTCDFIRNEKRKRVLIYVNRVAEADNNYLTVENMKKDAHTIFPPEFKTHFIAANTKARDRKRIFKRFSDERDDSIHVIVSCRTISVGVDLPTCDSVVFAETSKNITEIVQRGCRPLRLTDAEKSTGKFENAKIFFPINVSATELHCLTEQANRNEKLHRKIRGDPLEIPMLVLNLLKEGLAIDFDFTKDDSSFKNSCHFHGVQDDHRDRGENAAVQVHVTFPYTEYVWEESSNEFAMSMQNLCVSIKREERIPGFDQWGDAQKVSYLKNWCDEHGGQKPKQGSKCPEEAKLAQWLNVLGNQKRREKLRHPPFNDMKKFDWWNPWLEKLEKAKVEKIPGFVRWNDAQKVSYLKNWCDEHGGQRPKRGSKCPKEAKLAQWLNGLGTQKRREKLRHPPFNDMKKFDWWNPWLEKLEKAKVEKIPGFDQWGDAQKVSYLENWCDEHGGQRPKNRSKCPEEAKLAQWLSDLSNKERRKKLRHPRFNDMKRFNWWNPWLEKLEKAKVEKIPGSTNGTTRRGYLISKIGVMSTADRDPSGDRSAQRKQSWRGG